jgi:hypothetical protein
MTNTTVIRRESLDLELELSQQSQDCHSSLI